MFKTAAMGISIPNQPYIPPPSNPVSSWPTLIENVQKDTPWFQEAIFSYELGLNTLMKTKHWKGDPLKQFPTKCPRGILSRTTDIKQINDFRSHTARSLFCVRPSWPPAHFTHSRHFWHKRTTERQAPSNLVISGRPVYRASLPIPQPT